MTIETEFLAFPFTSPLPLNLPDEYRVLQEREPIIRVSLPTGDRAWLVTRYEDVRQVLADPRFSRAAAVRSESPRCSKVGVDLDPNAIFSKDPPEHTRLRRLVAPSFTTRRIEAMRPRIKQIVDMSLDSMEKNGPPVDLVADFARPLQITIICEILGILEANRTRFPMWSEVFTSTTTCPDHEAKARQSIARLERYIADLITDKRAHPTDDLLSQLIVARDEEEKLTEDELISLVMFLVNTGFRATSTQIVNSVVTLMRHPEELFRLRRDPDLVPGAVEELLRYIPRRTDGGSIRIALEDVELGEITVLTGEEIIPAISSANRDSTQFAEADKLDFTRFDKSHLTFGFGSHYCLGAPLARLELQVIIAALVRRFPGLRLAVPEQDLVWRTGTLVLGPAALPVTW